MSNVINFKDLEQVNLFEKTGIVSLEVKGRTINIPIKIKNLETSIMDIDITPNKLKLKSTLQSFKALEPEQRKIIENSEGFNPHERNQFVKIYDITDMETARELKHSALKTMVLEVVKEFDMDYESENSKGEKVTLWQLWNLEKGQYAELCETFMRMGVDEVLISTLAVQIAKIKNGTMLERIEEDVEVENEEVKVEKSPRKRKSKADTDSTRTESIS
jgi:hypothetical protein